MSSGVRQTQVSPEVVHLAEELILELWELLRTTSPNLGSEAPTARIYQTSEKDGEDIQGILDVLLLATANQPHATCHGQTQL